MRSSYNFNRTQFFDNQPAATITVTAKANDFSNPTTPVKIITGNHHFEIGSSA
jgi:hypothetical protein